VKNQDRVYSFAFKKERIQHRTDDEKKHGNLASHSYQTMFLRIPCLIYQ